MGTHQLGENVDGKYIPVAQREVARRLASSYLSHLRAKNSRHCPWNTHKPVEEAQVWRHFILAAAIVMEMEAKENDFIAAQFVGIRRFVRSRFPFPSQLHTDNARLRYIDFVEAQEQRESTLAKPEHLTVSDPLKRERMKLASLARRFRKEQSEVLRLMPREFSPALHQAMGSWHDVRSLLEETP